MWAVHHDLIDSIFFIQSKEGCDQITSEMVDLGEKAMVFGQIQTKFWHIHPNENLFHQSTLGTAKPFPKWLRLSQLPPGALFFRECQHALFSISTVTPRWEAVTFTRGPSYRSFRLSGWSLAGDVWFSSHGLVTFWPLLFYKVDFLNGDDIHTHFPTTKIEPTNKKNRNLDNRKNQPHKKKRVSTTKIWTTQHKKKHVFFGGCSFYACLLWDRQSFDV